MASGLSLKRFGRVAEALRERSARGEIAGGIALVERHGERTVALAGVMDLADGRPMARDTIFRVASVTKPLTAVAAMILVEETRLHLDDPVDQFLPELADRRVLRSLDGSLADTVAADRAITLRDLLTFRAGLGAVMAMPGTHPIQRAMEDAGVGPGPVPCQIPPDEFMRRIGALPLIHQPGERWMYHTAADILGVLIARASGMDLGEFMRQRLFEPLGMKDTDFSVPGGKLDRFATCYVRDESGALAVWDTPRGGMWSSPPAFPSGGGGLVSTADDLAAFGRMMLNMGAVPGGRILSRPAVELMTTDHITPAQKAASFFYPGFWDSQGWGFGMSVVTRRDGVAASPGRYGWDGGYGTTLAIDPREDLVAVFLMQRVMTGPDDFRINEDFLTLTYSALDD